MYNNKHTDNNNPEEKKASEMTSDGKTFTPTDVESQNGSSQKSQRSSGLGGMRKKTNNSSAGNTSGVNTTNEDGKKRRN